MSLSTWEALAEDALLLRLEARIELRINRRVHAIAAALRAAALPGVNEIVPAYASVLLRFDPQRWSDHAALYAHIAPLLASAAAGADAVPRIIEIPVCYGGSYGADLDAAAAALGLDTAELIARHCAPLYRVAMLGFAPGFAYLLGLDPALTLPRRATPRTRVPAGSVAIGGAQTGIYPAELPGGWHLLGRTPRRLFDATRDPPALLQAGDGVRFVAITAAQFDAETRP